MIAWHGSPILFDRFDVSRIKTASEGFGIYITERRNIASHYAAPGVWRKESDPRAGYVYEVEAPDGEYIDNSKPLDDQPATARAILLDAVAMLSGSMSGWWRFVIANAPTEYPRYTQVGKTLYFARQNGTPVEPTLATAGYAGCKYVTDLANEFAIFDSGALRIISVSALSGGKHPWVEAAQ